MSKELTAMQELRQRILIRYPYGAEDMTPEMKDMQSWLIEEIDLASIPKEKEQIENAFIDGHKDAHRPFKNTFIKSSDYFNQTYK